MRRTYSWLAVAAMMGMASGSRSAEPAPIRIDSEPIISAFPLSPGIVTPYISSAPMIVNGYLVYPTNRPTHTLPIHDRTKKGPARLWWDYVRSPQHQAEPEGAWNPVGAGSFWTDFKFAYGSSRQFLGSAESAPVHRQLFNPELEPGYILRAWHPRKYGQVR